MKITITSTETLAEVDGLPVRVWEGVTAAGVPCKVLVHRVALPLGADGREFDAVLKSVGVSPQLRVACMDRASRENVAFCLSSLALCSKPKYHTEVKALVLKLAAVLGLEHEVTTANNAAAARLNAAVRREAERN